MRFLVFVCLCIAPFAAVAEDQSDSPLTTEEGRKVLERLYLLESVQEQNRLLREYISSDQELDKKAEELNQGLLDVEKQRTALAEEKAKVNQEKADMYKGLYETLSKKPSLGCKIYRIVTLGIGRCS